jgi:hypothetical protein
MPYGDDEFRVDHDIPSDTADALAEVYRMADEMVFFGPEELTRIKDQATKSLERYKGNPIFLMGAVQQLRRQNHDRPLPSPFRDLYLRQMSGILIERAQLN